MLKHRVSSSKKFDNNRFNNLLQDLAGGYEKNAISNDDEARK